MIFQLIALLSIDKVIYRVLYDIIDKSCNYVKDETLCFPIWNYTTPGIKYFIK